MTREEEEEDDEEEVALAKELKTSHEGQMDGLKMKSPNVSERRDRNLWGEGGGWWRGAENSSKQER